MNEFSSKDILPQLTDAHIFPLKDGSKQPKSDWNSSYNGEQNYAVHTGDSGFVVMDLDRGHADGVDGVEEFLKLAEGKMPDTFTVDTPSGGKHLYFLDDAGIGRHPGMWAGVDVLGGSGYVVGPGSEVDGKEYVVTNDTAIKPLPAWLKEKIQAKLAKPEPQIKVGWARNMRRQASAYEQFTERLEGMGLSRNGGNWQCPAHDDRTPSMSVTDGGDRVLVNCFADCELEAICGAMGITTADLFDRRSPQDHSHASTGQRARSETSSQKGNGPTLPTDASGMAGFLNLKSFAELDRTPLDYRIDGLLPMGSNVLFSAYRKAGKTTTVLYLLKALTSKEKFIGRYTESVEGTVVYLNFELTEQMLASYAEQVGLDLDNGKLKVAQLRGEARKVDILSDDFAVLLAETLDAVKCEVLVVDPLSAVLGSHGIDEWSNPLNRQVLEQFGAIGAASGVNTLIIVDHAGHSEKGRSRGASSKEDWADVLWVLDKKTDGSRTLKVEGRGVEDETVTFVLDKEKRELIVTDDEKPFTDDLVYKAISDSPGIETTELVRVTGLKRPTLINRVGALESRKAVRVDRPGMKKPNKHYPVF